jgi:predicted nucleic acid-binding protein
MEISNDRVFLDTNILVYAYSITEMGKKEIALRILEEEIVCMSTQVINEFIWVMNRKYGAGMFHIKPIVKALFELYNIALIDHRLIDQAIELSTRFCFAYWDSLIVASAIEAGCDRLISEDLTHGQMIDGTMIQNPFKMNN